MGEHGKLQQPWMPGTRRCFCACSVQDATAGAELMVQVYRDLSDSLQHKQDQDDADDDGDGFRCAAHLGFGFLKTKNPKKRSKP
jgi:hypothetical protein